MILLPTRRVENVTIYVGGEVNNPGIYSLEAGSRVNDAIQAAGGFTLQADVEALNMAAKLDDENRITVPDKNNSVSPTSESKHNSLININSANVDDLDKLPGVGKVKAEMIIEFRIKNGPFFQLKN